MPVKCKKVGDKWRVVESSSGNISKTTKGNSRDGGGHSSEGECQSQANAINANREDNSPKNSSPRGTHYPKR